MNSYREQLIPERMPRHIAVIMDGNGRWAKRRNLPRTFGHRKGADIVREITTAAAEIGLEYLTLYAFSVENWNRPQEEVDALMNLLVEYIAKETPTLMKNNVRLLTIGDTGRLPEKTREKFMECIRTTSQNTGLSLVLAISYSARWEISEAIRKAVRLAQAGELRAEEIDEQKVASLMTTADMPDPDLLIRTSGELRISNFLLWQLAYSEMYFTDSCWPEFTEEEFYKAIVDYQHRERRFGKTSEQLV